MQSTGPGSELWKQLQKVRVTNGKIEAPVRANGKDGIQVGDFSLTEPRPASARGDEEPVRRRGLLARLLRRG
ncbi:hypothetical protein GUY44_16590 [Pimelobacter simplex]|uniref:Uncharacterized protein n=1 Tax=Nocardioides simplex TaxID=2045 RepID=A0A0A1DK54_NOCSI|nr:hypothetical protein [Pimelobacter simplex]AIY16953.1 hypothetical protein KR76_09635 [Pimelobacter simplex]MCG8152108.1 hypothetical protein [Pimelobacter simplex]GEB12858.1 hypothetical protein NSI01_11730 [Pimelobacter simplex]SFM53210.1 hypothetical protein SAMN05421671_2171 [Pimelobacter simplex]